MTRKVVLKCQMNLCLIETAEGWQLSNPPILSLAAVRASLSIFDEVGMSALVEKIKQLTSYLVFLLNQLSNDRIKIITPNERGCRYLYKKWR